MNGAVAHVQEPAKRTPLCAATTCVTVDQGNMVATETRGRYDYEGCFGFWLDEKWLNGEPHKCFSGNCLEFTTVIQLSESTVFKKCVNHAHLRAVIIFIAEHNNYGNNIISGTHSGAEVRVNHAP